MKRRTINESGEPAILFVLGFGERVDGDDVGWFADRLADAGYRVDLVELPTNGAVFERTYLDPVQRIHDEQDPTVVLGHSLGGLVAAFLETSARSVYLSPWWGLYEGKVSEWERWLVPKLPIRRPVLPTKTRPGELGEHLSPDDWAALPKRISPVFVTEVYRAQQALPPIDDDAVVFASLEDTIVSLQAIGAAVDPEQVHLYDGGHRLYSASGREDAIDELLAVLPG